MYLLAQLQQLVVGRHPRVETGGGGGCLFLLVHCSCREREYLRGQQHGLLKAFTRSAVGGIPIYRRCRY